jgi:uncharacterized protein YbjT (DUF2867 family)
MRIAIFGGTGKTGALVLRQLLGAGHQVTALVRDPTKLPLHDDNLRLVKGDARTQDALTQTVRQAQAVVSALSGGQGTLTEFGTGLVPAMEREGVSRVISLIGASVRIEGDPSTIGLAFLHMLTSVMAKDVLADGEAYAEVLLASGLDYTLVRPPRLTDGPLTGRVRHAANLKLSPASSISRADVAAFMAEVALNGDYARSTPMITSE